mmetsp:Transcript_14776/g.30567  ORF Transcript_14776/g.30567 Transcript_14776/m.30567 type:complete len:285 (-) Transcript_14776:80-934(-)
MCDYFDMPESKGNARHEDDFPIGWHPHRGMDIASYLKSGLGRHGDSLGNRETFSTPGMQWMSVGSGVYHAEGGANDKGEVSQGFQIWINVPKEHKMDDPDYGTVTNEEMPILEIGDKKGSKARILAGDAFEPSDPTGPFRTKCPVQMIDLEMAENDTFEFEIADGLDTAMLYVYEGALASVNGSEEKGKTVLKHGTIVLLDADDKDRRRICLATSSDVPAGVMLFAGKKLKEPIAWHGPIVMNTQEQIHDTFMEMRMGDFPPKRVPWDYKRWASRPDDWEGPEL